MIEQQYTIAFLAKIFKKHPRTIRRWVEEGLFPNAKRVKGEIYIPERDVLDVLEPKEKQQQPSQRRIISRGIS